MVEDFNKARDSFDRIYNKIIVPYNSNLEALADHLELIRILLFRNLEIMKEYGARDPSKIIETRVEDSELNFFFRNDFRFSSDIFNLNRKVLARRYYLKLREAICENNSIKIPLFEIKKIFSLSEIVHTALMAVIAPAYDHSFLRAYTRAWGDFTRREVDIAFLLDLCPLNIQEREELMNAFFESAPLLKYSLVHLQSQKGGVDTDFIHRIVILDDQVLSFFRGYSEIDPSIINFAKLIIPQRNLEEVKLPDELKFSALKTVKESNNWSILFSGSDGSGRQSLAEALFKEIKANLLVVNLDDFVDYPQPQDIIKAIFRDAKLTNAIPVFRLSEDLGSIEEKTDRTFYRERQFFRIIRSLGRYNENFIIIAPENSRKIKENLPNIMEFRFDIMPRNIQYELWRNAIEKTGHFTENLSSHLNQLVGRFHLTGGAIEKAVSIAIDRMRQRKGDYLEINDLIQGGQVYLSHCLDAIAQRIPTTFDWDDLVVPENTMNQLQEIVTFYRYREKVFFEWGFVRKIPYGKGLSVLFWGPPGTGKTMAAMILAKEFNLELFRIDLSQIVSKYIGETEKNLSKLFDEATKGNILLLFDEADSLFAKRTEVKDSVDRYANLEVNYLLQRIDNFDGVAIMTTNMQSSIDEAFRRRIRFSVEFPFPDENIRKMLWISMIPKEAEVEKHIDYDRLARDFEIAGGNIKNAVLKAAFKSAEEGTPITRKNLRKYAEMECISLGKTVRIIPEEEC